MIFLTFILIEMSNANIIWKSSLKLQAAAKGIFPF